MRIGASRLAKACVDRVDARGGLARAWPQVFSGFQELAAMVAAEVANHGRPDRSQPSDADRCDTVTPRSASPAGSRKTRQRCLAGASRHDGGE